jgi:MFS family permease
VTKQDARQGQDQRFLLLYALALAGGTIAYVPFLTILLPMQIASLAPQAKVAWLAYATFAGALTASFANIAFGWLSDRMASRLPLVIAGLLLSSVLLVSFAHVGSFLGLIMLVIGWQAALNLMLAPLAAWAGDCVPDHQKGTLGGLIAVSPAAGALSAAFITLPGLADSEQRLWLVAAFVLIMVVPALVMGRPRHFPELLAPRLPSIAPDLVPVADRLRHGAVIKMWIARLLVQVSESALFAFLYFWLRSLDSTIKDAGVAQLFCAVLVCSIPVSLVVGRWSDRHGRPLAPLPAAAVVATAGLLLMAAAATPLVAMAGYALFALTAAVFLSLHSAQTLALLPDPARRGMHLGLFNLTNTAPAMIMPWLTLAIEPIFGFAGLFVVLSLCAFSAAALLITIPPSRAQSTA